MRRPKIALVLPALVVAGIAGFILASWESAPPVAPGIAFADTEPGRVYEGQGFQSRAAGIYITNRDPRGLSVFQIQVQVLADNLWRTVSEGPPEVSPVLEPGESTANKDSPLLAGGDHRRYVVPWPAQRPWRVHVSYAWELKGTRSLMARIRVAWRLRDPSVLLPEGSALGELHEIVSEEISK